MKGWRYTLVLAAGLALAACGTTNPGGGGGGDDQPATGTFLKVEGNSAAGVGGTWYGGGDIKVVPASGYSSVTFSATGLGSFTGGTATATGLTISKATYGSTYPTVTFTATTATKTGGGTVTPSASDASLAFKLDNQAPAPSWDVPRQGGFEVGCQQWPFTTTQGAIPPGTTVTWPYKVADAGAGVKSVTHLNAVERAFRLTDGANYERWVEWPDTSWKTTYSLALGSTASGNISFVVYGHAKHHALRASDVLGNTNNEADYGWVIAPDKVTRNPAHDLICNAYWNESQYPYLTVKDLNQSTDPNPSYVDAKNHHIIPELTGVTGGSATGFSATATGVVGNPDPSLVRQVSICEYCGKSPTAVTHVLFFRRPKGATNVAYEYVGRVDNPSSSSVTYTDASFSATPAASFDFAVAVINERAGVGFFATDATFHSYTP